MLARKTTQTIFRLNAVRLQRINAAYSNYAVFFTPYDDCTTKIINEIKAAKESIHIQAYIFTCKPVARAIAIASQNGIDVKVILDDSQFTYKYSTYEYLKEKGVPVWSDHKPSLAHSKVIIVDKSVVITGSFNLTRAAQEKNTENLLIIRDKELADLYFDNWEKRLSVSKKMT